MYDIRIDHKRGRRRYYLLLIAKRSWHGMGNQRRRRREGRCRLPVSPCHSLAVAADRPTPARGRRDRERTKLLAAAAVEDRRRAAGQVPSYPQLATAAYSRGDGIRSPNPPFLHIY
jgi:hypothetical protein